MNSLSFPTELPTVFFDGHCNLCSHSVLFVLRNDKHDQLFFASLQSDFAKQSLGNALPGYTTRDHPSGKDLQVTTLIFMEDGVLYERSDAVIRISGYLRSPWRYLRYAKYVPVGLRDAVYNIIARYRFTIFGRHDRCFVPNADLSSRFLDGDLP